MYDLFGNSYLIMYIFNIFLTQMKQNTKYTIQNICRNFSCAIKKNAKNEILISIINSNTVINRILKNNGILNDEQWPEIRMDLMKSFNLTQMNLDSKIFDVCFYYKKYDEAKRYFKFLESNNYEIKLNVIGNYFKSFSLEKKPINEEEEKEILRVYDNLREKYIYLDKMTCSNCINILSLTKRWKESLSLVKMIEIIDTVGVKNMAAIIIAALKNNEIEFAWKEMNKIIPKLPLASDVYEEYLKFCQRNFNGIQLIQEIEKIFIFWRNNKVNPSKDIIDIYANFFKSIGYSTNITAILKNGSCSHCKLFMNKTTIGKDQFQILSISILKNVIIGKNLFYTSSPEELKEYLVFINSMKSYDVVIDGLNVAYAFSNHFQSSPLKPILDIVNYFSVKGYRVLLIGRNHMMRWSKEIMTDIKKKSDIFLIKDITQDDPFLLHITLTSGPDTYFVSRDLMRSHKFKLVNSNVKKLFVDWQLSRQYSFTLDRTSKTVRLIPPVTFEMKAQKNEKGWHIPYKSHNALEDSDNYNIHETWLCLKYQK